MAEMYIPEDASEQEIVRELFEMRDEKYAAFQARIINNMDSDKIIGVRTPDLRKYARKIFKDGRGEKLISAPLPHYYFEVMNLHAFVIEQTKDFDTAVRLTEDFLPHIDNWATCDLFSPKIFKQNTDKLIVLVRKWLAADDVYAVRYGIVTLINHYLKDNFDTEHLEWVAAINSEEFYIKMAQAWYFSMALVYRYDETIPYFTGRRLSDWIHNKAIQKARESRQISPEIKQYLNTLKIK